MAISADEFRAALGRWASGVTIITTRSGDRVHGMTVSDFSGVSLSPPLVSICAARESITTGLIAESRGFAVKILSADQKDRSNRFASTKDEHRRFEGLETVEASTGAPLIPGAIVQLDCSLHAIHEAGDHIVYIGQIEWFRTADGAPLLYYGGSYGEVSGTA